MSSELKYYLLSQAADQDIVEIFDFSASEFGQEKAVDYLGEFEELFHGLVANPKLGVARNDIRQGLRSFPKNAHIVFYRIMDDHIRIVRVLHYSRDVRYLL
ncbi:MAG: type II toxin-antitoxin system RelE/ParE family toxin [Cyclobacteriaceae bacterium]